MENVVALTPLIKSIMIPAYKILAIALGIIVILAIAYAIFKK